MSKIIVPLWARILILVVYGLIACWIGVRIGANGEKANELEAVNQTAKHIDQRDSAIGGAITASRAQAGASQATIEDQTHGTQEHIRSQYRPGAVGADCRQPDGVSVDLGAAIERTNRRVRAAAGAADRPSAAGPGMSRDR